MSTIDITPVPANCHLEEEFSEEKGQRFAVWNNSDKTRRYGWVRPTLDGQWIVTDAGGIDWSKTFDERNDALWLLVQFRGCPDPFKAGE